jgi:phytoene dehydrogenase-like protein
MDRYHSIIVGAGHNGMVCASYLARKGQRVLVLEASDRPGGLGAGREFHPGFHASVAHSIGHFSSRVASDLNLSAHGFSGGTGPMPTIGLSRDKQHVTLQEGAPDGVGAADAKALGDYTRLMHRFADTLKPFWLKTIPRLGEFDLKGLKTFAHMGLSIRGMGKQDMREFMRVTSLPARDLLDEFFDNEILKALLSWDGLIGSKMAPRSPNGAVLAMLYRLAGEDRGAHSIPAGGVNGLMEALHRAAKASGAEIKFASPVEKILVAESADGLTAEGVRLAGGETIGADRVISSADPQTTFFELVGVECLEIGFTNRIRRLRCDGLVAKLHLALDSLPQFDGLQRPDGRMIIAPGMDTIEFAFDDAKYGGLPENPVMELTVPSLHEPSLAPEGCHVLSAHVMYVPHRLRGGWDDAARERLCQRAIDTIAQYAPRIRDQILHRELLTPPDLEQRHLVTGGHWHHTEFAMDQMLMMRPTYEAAQYATPIPGLFLCGAGSHPAGDITGAAGHNAAREILR